MARRDSGCTGVKECEQARVLTTINYYSLRKVRDLSGGKESSPTEPRLRVQCCLFTMRTTSYLVTLQNSIKTIALPSHVLLHICFSAVLVFKN